MRSIVSTEEEQRKKERIKYYPCLLLKYAFRHEFQATNKHDRKKHEVLSPHGTYERNNKTGKQQANEVALELREMWLRSQGQGRL